VQCFAKQAGIAAAYYCQEKWGHLSESLLAAQAQVS
jgi:nucleotide-binding universal stress UspA family protein